jgi:hypothetical protein
LAVEKMVRKASDNKYLHKDFHNFMNLGLVYLAEQFGDDAVREYLRQLAASYYAPLTADLGKRGLIALKEHFEKIYGLEEASDDIELILTDDTLEMRIKNCPAVEHMNQCGVAVSPLFVETSKTLYQAICEGTPYEYRLDRYDAKTGASVEYFRKRGANQ